MDPQVTITPDAPQVTITPDLPSAASPIAPPAMQRPNVPMSQVYLDTGNPVPPPQTWKDVVSGASKNLWQMSSPGIALSAINQRFPNAPIPQAVKDLATPMKQLPQQMVTNMAPIIAGGMDEPAPNIQPSARPQVQTPQAPSTGPTIGSIMARHIPVVGKVLRTIDDVQALLGKDAPHPTSTVNVAPPKPTLPPEAPLQIRQAWALRNGGQTYTDPASGLGTIPQANIPGAQSAPIANPKTPIQPPMPGPKTYEVTRGIDPITHPNAPANWEKPSGYSTNIDQYGYHPDSQTISVKYDKGAVYQFKATPQMYSEMKKAPSTNGYVIDVLAKAQTNGRGKYIGTVTPKGGQQ